MGEVSTDAAELVSVDGEDL